MFTLRSKVFLIDGVLLTVNKNNLKNRGLLWQILLNPLKTIWTFTTKTKFPNLRLSKSSLTLCFLFLRPLQLLKSPRLQNPKKPQTPTVPTLFPSLSLTYNNKKRMGGVGYKTLLRIPHEYKGKQMKKKKKVNECMYGPYSSSSFYYPSFLDMKDPYFVQLRERFFEDMNRRNKRYSVKKTEYRFPHSTNVILDDTTIEETLTVLQ